MNINEERPKALKGIADDTGKSEEEIGKLWDKALADYDKKEDELNGEDYGILIGKVKDAAGVKGDVDSETSGKNTNESYNQGEDDVTEAVAAAMRYISQGMSYDKAVNKAAKEFKVRKSDYDKIHDYLSDAMNESKYNVISFLESTKSAKEYLL